MAEGPKSHVEACILSLIGAGALSIEDAARARSAAQSGESPLSAARRLGLIPDEAAAEAAAATLGLRYIGTAAAAALPAPPATGAPQPAFLKAHDVALAPAPDGAGLIAALADPFDEALRRAISMSADGPVTFAATTKAGVEAWRKSLNGAARGGQPARAAAPEEAATGAAVEAVEALLETAARLGASDLHLEPGPDGGRARARVDGAMRVIGTLDEAAYPAAIARACPARSKRC